MRAIIIFFLIIFLSVWSKESAGQTADSYFPMQIGNRWTFSVAEPEPFPTVPPDTVTETIVDTVRVGDSLFFRFDRFGDMTDPLMRMTADNKLLVMIDGTPQVRLDFTAAVGDTWQLPSPFEDLTWEVSLDDTSETVVVPVGTFADCYRFRVLGKSSNEYMIDYGWEEHYASQVGPVKKYYEGAIPHSFLLIEARVNGVDYSTHVARTSPAVLPQSLHLFANYPNPFNASTTIRFELPSSRMVALEIYGLLGQKLRILVNEKRSAGQHQVLWDGRDDAGNSLPSGVYLCRLSAGEFVATKRMVLLR